MKKEIIQQTETILKNNGFVQMDYIVSLQGPTLILATSGEKKITDSIREEVKKTGMQIL